ncbi:hypothetical protein NPIL_630791, partial [Nephila pilipes]
MDASNGKAALIFFASNSSCSFGCGSLVFNDFQSPWVSKLTIIQTQPIIKSTPDLMDKKNTKGLVLIQAEQHEVLE